MKKLMTVAMATLMFCVSAPAAFAQQVNLAPAAPDDRPLSPEMRAEAAKAVDTLTDMAKTERNATIQQMAGQASANGLSQQLITSLVVRVSALEKIHDQLRNPRCVVSATRIVEVIKYHDDDVALRLMRARQAGILVNTLQTASEAREALVIAQAAWTGLKQLRKELVTPQPQPQQYVPQAPRVNPIANVPSSWKFILAGFGGVNQTGIGGFGLGIESFGHQWLDGKFDVRMAFGGDNHAEIDYLAAAKIDFHREFAIYAGFHAVSIAENGFSHNVTENRFGGALGAEIFMGKSNFAFDLRGNLDHGVKFDPVLGVTFGIQYGF